MYTLSNVIDKFRSLYYQNRYGIKGKLNIVGRVRLDNPNIRFGNNVTLFEGVQIWGKGLVEIGDNTAIGKDTIIFAAEKISIGSDVAIAGQCYIIDCDHKTDRDQLIREQALLTSAVYIGNDVWVGAGSKILKGAKLSDGTVIGALSLVMTETEPYSINVGIPTKKISERK